MIPCQSIPTLHPMKKKPLNPVLLALLAVVALLGPSGAQTSAVPDLISYQGRALDGTGTAIGTGTPVNRKIIFRIWSHPTNSGTGDLVYSEEQVVTITNGDFSALIGAGSATAGAQFSYNENGKGKPTVSVSNADVFGSNSRYLGVTIDDGTAAADNEISPRQQFVTSSYAFRAKLAEGVPTGAISSGMLQNGAVGSSQLANGAVGSSQLAAGAVGSSQLAAGVVTSDKLANDSVTGAKISNGTIEAVDFKDGSVTSAKIQDGTIATADLADSSVTSVKISDGTIATADLSDSSVTSVKISDGTIATADLADSSVTSAKISDGTIGESDFGLGVVSSSAIKDGTLQPADLSGLLGGINGFYNYFRVNGGNSDGFLFGAYNQPREGGGILGEGIHLAFNCRSDNSNWIVPNNGLAQSRITLGNGDIIFFTAEAGSNQLSNAGGLQRMVISRDGRVGIGTGAPYASLHVAGSVSRQFYSDWIVHGGGTGDQNLNRTEAISIWADNHIASNTFWVHSDERIKVPGDLSNGSNDLDVLKAIEIRDYTHKDKVQMGSQVSKKVIAQQVEAVYPLAVHQSRGVVPDIYKKARIDQDWIALESDLKVGEKVRLILQDKGPVMEKVLEVRPGAFRTALVSEPTDLFVYGREVEDFRTVDYDALSMLNVSATQELARQLDRVREENEALRREIEALKADHQSGVLALEKRLIEEGLLKPVSLERESAAR